MSPVASILFIVTVGLLFQTNAELARTTSTGNRYDVALLRASSGLSISRGIVEGVVGEISKLEGVNLYELFSQDAVPYIGEGIANYLNHRANGPDNNQTLPWYKAAFMLKSEFERNFWPLIESSCTELTLAMMDIVKRVESKQEVVESLNEQSRGLITDVKLCVNVLTNTDKIKQAAYRKAKHYKLLSL